MVHGGLSVVLWLAMTQYSQARAEDVFAKTSHDGVADSGSILSDSSMDSGFATILDTAMGLEHTGGFVAGGDSAGFVLDSASPTTTDSALSEIFDTGLADSATFVLDSAAAPTDSDTAGTLMDSGAAPGTPDSADLNFDTALLDTVMSRESAFGFDSAGGTESGLDTFVGPETGALSDSSGGTDSSTNSVDSSGVGFGPTGGPFGGFDTAAMVGSAGIVINEFMPNPDSTDGGNEWVELLNVGTVSVNLSGWSFQRSTSGSWSTRHTFSSYTLQAGERLVLGGEFVAGADINLPSGSVLEMGNASSSGDAIRLVDDFGDTVDTVIYGPNNSDGFIDDTGSVATSVAPTPGSGDSLGRLPDGSDTDNSGVDFVNFNTPTPGATNGGGSGGTGGHSGDTGVSGGLFPAGSVLINEFLPDPGSAGGDKGHEWIEFYNATSSTIDLKDWEVQRSTSSSFSTRYTFGSVSIAPGAYLVLGGEFVNGADVKLASGTGIELGNASSSGDLVRLVDPAGGVIDTVIYGPDNSDGFEDDNGFVTSSVAPKPATDASLARVPDGVDTNDSGVDFVLTGSPTLGAANADPCGTKAADASGLVINEFIPNPAGTDSDFEWVELYNGSGARLDLSGWAINTGTSSFTKAGIIPSGTEVAAGDFIVLGQTETSVPEVDVAVPGFSLGNSGSTNADGVRLEDCEGTVVDTVIYGGDNTSDQWIDDSGDVATSLAPSPKEGVSIARVDDGVDTDRSAVDFEIPVYSTPGDSNDAVPTTCGGPTSGIVINEFVSNPVGSDSDAKGEWVEIYHGGTESIDIQNWSFQVATSSFSTKYTWEESTVLRPGDFILIGDELVSNTDITLALSLPNATSNSDALRIVDCRGFAADTVVYGGPNTDEIVDDTNAIATNTAVSPGEGQSAARVQDGYDTNNSRFDFIATSNSTPGTSNPVNEPIVCAPDDGGVTLNEALVDPEGSDSEVLKEWVELYNSSPEDASIAGWWLSVDDEFVEISTIIPGGSVVPTMGWFVLGQEFVEEADVVVSLDLGNGSGGDGIRLYDCEGTPVDTLVYGDEENEDGVLDDDGEAPVNLPNPGSDESVARVEDGVDTNDVDDWKVARRTTPGASNVSEGIGDTDDGSRGCGRKDDGAPGGCGGSSAPPEGDMGGGCSTVPLPLGGLELFAALVAIRRRRHV